MEIEINEQTIKGIIDRLNDLEQRNVHIWQMIDHLEKMINDNNGNGVVNL